LLAIDDHPLLKLASSALNLLKHNRTEEVWLVSGVGVFQQTKGHTF
jgi:hypothetical protein